jgi:hypothetical protein
MVLQLHEAVVAGAERKQRIQGVRLQEVVGQVLTAVELPVQPVQLIQAAVGVVVRQQTKVALVVRVAFAYDTQTLLLRQYLLREAQLLP